MRGIWVAVKATTSTSGSSRNTTLKLWKSRPAAPMMTTRFCAHRRPPVPLTSRSRLRVPLPLPFYMAEAPSVRKEPPR